jgi:F0F1-type ATP synthase epsilon subunit
MLLTITSPDQQLRQWTIQKVTIPTDIGEITVLPGHQPLISVVASWLLKLVPEEMPGSDQWRVIDNGHIVIAVSKGIVMINHDEIIITTAVGTNTVKDTVEVLEKMHQEMEEKIAQIKVDWNEESLEDAFNHMEKISADLRIAKIGHVRS